MTDQYFLVENCSLFNMLNVNVTSYFCAAGEAKSTKVDFLGLSVEGASAIAGQWVLLVLGVVLLVATILLAYKYRRSKKPEKSLSTMELKQKD